MKAWRFVLGMALLAGAAACGDTPAPLLPAGPSYDGGHTLGSGGGTGTVPGATVQGDSLGRGHTLGSGG